MKSPKEIKLGLECCTPGDFQDCDICPYEPLRGCADARIDDTLAYIQQLEREKEELVKNKLFSEGTSLDLREVVKVCEGELLVCAINMIIDMQAAAPKWISVEERLPKQLYDVCLIYADGFIEVATWALDKHGMCTWFFVDGEYETGVTHWMPLPEPPEEEE